MEETRQAFVKEVPNRYRAYDIPQRYTPELLARAEALLNRAVAQVANGPEIYRQRIEFIRAGLQHNAARRRHPQFDAESRREKQRPRDAEAVARVKANWEKAARMP